jgi:hypothetical protein
MKASNDADKSAEDTLKAMKESNNKNKKAKANENKNETNSDITDAEIKKEAYADANKLGAKLEDLTKGMEEKANAKQDKVSVDADVLREILNNAGK